MRSRSYSKAKVYCRVRPLQCSADFSCVNIKNDQTLVLSPPEQLLQGKQHSSAREYQCKFTHVYHSTATQNDVFEEVAKPFVEQLIRGRNSLLFNYGASGSGKTFTMTGNKQELGIMPRCLDVLFQAVSEHKAKNFIFKPDRLNGFEILSYNEAEAAAMKSSFNDPTEAVCKVPFIDCIENNAIYAVFVSYVEVYNNAVHDLLDGGHIQKGWQQKIIREDCNHNMFVQDVTEVEVRSMEHALSVYHMGQKRKRLAQMVMNNESRRSHTVFNIRLVRAAIDRPLQNQCIISQLSLVDLAGSERTSRTRNSGMRLREAGNINNSLMILRTCLEYLRENQNMSTGMPLKKIPYRDSKITHFFKNFFECEGEVSIIICINPRAEDYDENAQVLKFAERTQEVKLGRRVTDTDKQKHGSNTNLYQLDMSEDNLLPVDVNLVYNLGEFCEHTLNAAEIEKSIPELKQTLQQRIEKRILLRTDLANRNHNFQKYLLKVEKQNAFLCAELVALKSSYQQTHEHALCLENQLSKKAALVDALNVKLTQRASKVDQLTKQLNEQKHLLMSKEQEMKNEQKKIKSKWIEELACKDREQKMKLREQRSELESQMRVKDEQFQLVSSILESESHISKPRLSAHLRHRRSWSDGA